MGEILGLGITHFPSLWARKLGPFLLKQVLRDPQLPEHYRTLAGWPEAMQREWGQDEGMSASEEHRQSLVAELRNARQALDEFAPDFVVVWGDDQYENFKEDVIPPFCVLAYDSMTVKPWQHEMAAMRDMPNFWNEPVDMTLEIRGHRAGAKMLVSGLLDENFDVAYAYQPLHRDLGHAFLNSVLYLDWDRRGFGHPIVPFPINCYGRRVIAQHGFMVSMAQAPSEDALDPPSPSPRRCFDLGAACAKVIARSRYRVALVASASWSHAFLTAKYNYLYPDISADRRLFDALQSGDYDVWRNTTLAAVEESGQQEVLNWFCLAGAMAELGRKPDHATFIETYILNSNKVMAIFKP